MFFPSLSLLSSYSVNDLIIQKLDQWLSLQRKATYSFLNPLQFSIDMGIDEETAIKIFALCTHPPISIMRAKYRLNCPGCGDFDRTVYDLDALKGIELECDNCGHPYSPYEFMNFIEIHFELLVSPTPDPSSTIRLPQEVEKTLGKSDSLRASDLNRPSLRGLLIDFYDEPAS